MNNRFLELIEDVEGKDVRTEQQFSLRQRPAYMLSKPEQCPQMSEVEVSPDDFVLDILQFFFTERLTAGQLNDELRQLAATMLWAAVEASRQMDLVPRPPAGRPSLVWLVSQAVQIAFRRANNRCIYVAVKNTVARNFRSAYEIAKLTGASAQSISRGMSRVDYTVPGIIPVLAQPSSMSCWATVFTMMYSWKHRQSISTETVLGDIGQSWLDIYRNDTGLSGNDKENFINAAGLVAEPPMSLSVQGWESMLRNCGPIWITTNEAPGRAWAIHARIIKGITGDGTPNGTQFTIIDPAGGRQYQESIAVFIPKYEDEVIRTGYTRIQILHWPAGAGAGVSRSHGLNQQLSLSEVKNIIHSVQFSDIPLDPGTGGRSIGPESLETGDIILSTTDALISAAIRRFTQSRVSHAMLYVGDQMVVEAIGSGVRLVPLESALRGATVAVAFRYPNLSHERALMIRDFAGNQIDRPYDRWGVVRQAGFQIDRRAICDRITDSAQRQRCISRVGRINLGTETNDSFFCSELVLAAYQHAGVPLTSTPPHWNTAEDIAVLRFTGNLGYVGHLIA